VGDRSSVSWHRTFAPGFHALRSLGGVCASPSGLRWPPTPLPRHGRPIAVPGRRAPLAGSGEAARLLLVGLRSALSI
jgi:hypothetical protein